jgi:hypothetical protein
MTINKELIDQGRSERGGLNREQLQILGVSWPPKTGWERRITGKEISVREFDEFLRLRNVSIRLRRQPKTIVKNDLPFLPDTSVGVQNVFASFWLYVSRLDGGTKNKVKPVLAYMLRKLNQ